MMLHFLKHLLYFLQILAAPSVRREPVFLPLRRLDVPPALGAPHQMSVDEGAIGGGEWRGSDASRARDEEAEEANVHLYT